MSAILDALRKAGDKYRRKYKELFGSSEEDSKQKEPDEHRKNQKHPKKKTFIAKIILTATTIFSLILIIICIFGIFIIFKSMNAVSFLRKQESSNKVEIIDKKHQTSEMQLTPLPPSKERFETVPYSSTPDISNEQKEETPTVTPESSNTKVKYKVTLEDLAKTNITPSPQPIEPPMLINNKAIEDLEKSESKIQIRGVTSPPQLQRDESRTTLSPQDKKPPIETLQTPKVIRIDDSSIDEEKEKGIKIKNETLPTPQIQTESSTEETQIPQKTEPQTTKEDKTPQPESSPKSEKPQSNDKFDLEGIVWDDKGALAIINGSMVKVGDTINGGKIIKIDKNSVEIEINSKSITITH